jgi:hypothetical protein
MQPGPAILLETVRRSMEYELRRHYMECWIPYLDKQYRHSALSAANNRLVHYYSNIQRDSLPCDNQAEEDGEADNARIESIINHMKQVPALSRLSEETDTCLRKARHMRHKNVTQIKAQHASALDTVIINHVAGLVFAKDKSVEMSQFLLKAFAFGADPFQESVREVLEAKIEAPTTAVFGFASNLDHRIVETLVLLPSTNRSDQMAATTAPANNLCIEGVIEHLGGSGVHQHLTTSIVDAERIARTRTVREIQDTIVETQGLTSSTCLDESIFLYDAQSKESQHKEQASMELWLTQVSSYIEEQELCSTGSIGHVVPLDRVLQAMVDLPPPSVHVCYPADYAVKHTVLNQSRKDKELQLGRQVAARVQHSSTFFRRYLTALLQKRLELGETRTLDSDRKEKAKAIIRRTHRHWVAVWHGNTSGEDSVEDSNQEAQRARVLLLNKILYTTIQDATQRLESNGFSSIEIDALILSFLAFDPVP